MKTTSLVQAVSTACALSMLIPVLTISASAAVSDKIKDRIDESAAVLREIHAAPDKDVPKELWDRATCVIVIPSLKKAAFVFGGEYGKGLMSCRKGGAWSAPVFMRLEKGSWGLQIGAQSIDLVLLVNNERGMKKLLGNKVTLGAEASVAAGPVGRDARAATDAQMNAEILSYSRTQGLFAGINLSGGVLRPDSDDNEDVYGQKTTPEAILKGETAAPSAAQPFMKALNR
ncbi:MAG TPA: lipid-binding SYLF domain-containing protein [Vicinamibacterales bacterium]|nr:lipid-binding SYLF domain-containing protein [Vicinamibacterales bacterium]